MPAEKLCIFGAGAIGGLIAARLAAGGVEISVVARGERLVAIRRDGLRLETPAGEFVARPAWVGDEPARLGPQDIVILAVKAPMLAEAAITLQPLLGPGTVIVPAVNGIPWWYFHGLAGPYEGRRLDSVDPGGRLWELLPPERVLGCVVNLTAETPSAGVVRSNSGQGLILGDIGGGRSEAAGALSELCTRAGLAAPISDDIRRDLWIKLWGNLAFNPLSILTGARLDRLASDPDTREVARRMMVEAEAVAGRLGVRFPVAVDARIAAAAALGPHKTSMLQDVERGRAVELDAVLGAVVEIAAMVACPSPTLDLIRGLARQRSRIAAETPPGAVAP